jgi:hypothetical protein
MNFSIPKKDEYEIPNTVRCIIVSPNKVIGKIPAINNPRNDDKIEITNPMKPYNICNLLLITM